MCIYSSVLPHRQTHSPSKHLSIFPLALSVFPGTLGFLLCAKFGVFAFKPDFKVNFFLSVCFASFLWVVHSTKLTEKEEKIGGTDAMFTKTKCKKTDFASKYAAHMKHTISTEAFIARFK